MLPSAQLLTNPTSHATYKTDDLSTAKSLISSSFIFLHVEQNQTKEREEMQPRPRSQTNDEELWFNMASSRRDEGQRQEQSVRHELSAYQYASSRHSASRSISPSRFPHVPVISTTSADKPLPESPEFQKKKHKPASLRNLLSRRPSHETINSAHLQPESARSHQRSHSKDGKLSPEPLRFPPRTSSRSMPNSPLDASSATAMTRAQSASPTYVAMTNHQAYSLFPAPLQTKTRSTSTETYFEPGAPRCARTFPETGRPFTAMPNDPRTLGPRPHTWLSPTEPFNNDDDFHLFAEATSGLPDGFDTMSPSEAPHLQASLFSRGRQNDIIPLPFQNNSVIGEWQSSSSEYIPRQRPRERSPAQPLCSYRAEPTREVVPIPSMDDEWDPQQRPGGSGVSSFALAGIDSFDQTPSYSAAPSSSVFPRRASYDRPPLSPIPANLIAVNMELERLGIQDQHHDDDELPNYEQSQAEMHERKRNEAAARARELESRWNSSRGLRGR